MRLLPFGLRLKVTTRETESVGNPRAIEATNHGFVVDVVLYWISFDRMMFLWFLVYGRTKTPAECSKESASCYHEYQYSFSLPNGRLSLEKDDHPYTHAGTAITSQRLRCSSCDFGIWERTCRKCRKDRAFHVKEECFWESLSQLTVISWWPAHNYIRGTSARAVWQRSVYRLSRQSIWFDSVDQSATPQEKIKFWNLIIY